MVRNRHLEAASISVTIIVFAGSMFSIARLDMLFAYNRLLLCLKCLTSILLISLFHHIFPKVLCKVSRRFSKCYSGTSLSTLFIIFSISLYLYVPTVSDYNPLYVHYSLGSMLKLKLSSPTHHVVICETMISRSSLLIGNGVLM